MTIWPTLRHRRQTASPNYRHFRTVADIARQFGASPQTQEALQRWFAARGITVNIDTTASFATTDIDARTATELFGADVGDYVSATATGRPRPPVT